jgi:hypothetical protein
VSGVVWYVVWVGGGLFTVSVCVGVGVRVRDLGRGARDILTCGDVSKPRKILATRTNSKS